MSDAKIQHYLIIIAFGAAIVALGVHDLSKRHKTKSVQSGDIKELVKDLRGDFNIEARASLARQEAENKDQEHGAKPDALSSLKGLVKKILP